MREPVSVIQIGEEKEQRVDVKVNKQFSERVINKFLLVATEIN